MIMFTINDFPAYGNLAGYSVKGHKACPICEEETSYYQLQHGRKTVYMGHRKFLQMDHPYRRMKKAFNGLQDYNPPPQPLSAEEHYNRVKTIDCTFGKKESSRRQTNTWKKRSIFFDLPYWRCLDLKHNIDVMHVEKNICDSLIGTLLNIKGKTKDGLHARLDLVSIGIRLELAPTMKGNRTYLPPACHTLSKSEKFSFCRCLHGIKVPSGYSSNVKNLVSLQDLKLIGLKSHDCHVLMQQLLPVALRGILPIPVRKSIIKLCYFFKSICSKVVDINLLDVLEKEAVVILCQLEMYFPPSFFDIMIHLMIHLVREIRIGGPVYLRWMYPFERYMKILKGYVKNPYRPEASIVQKYISEELVEFCTDYLNEVEHIGLPISRHSMVDSGGKGLRGLKIKLSSCDELMQAHLYILNNMDEVQPYISSHINELKLRYPRRPEKSMMIEHKNTFAKWFTEKVRTDISASETLKWLAGGPSINVITWSGFDINGYTFYTRNLDEKSTVQNSGVMVVAEGLHFSSAKDKNPIYTSTKYFGVIDEIWEIDYTKFRVAVFKCNWVDSNNGVKRDEYGLTLVDLKRFSCKEEQFIMATHAKQIFYIADPSNDQWSVVIQGKQIHLGDEVVDDGDDSHSSEVSSSIIQLSADNNDCDEDIVHAIRNDHFEGIWETTVLPTY